ncbi:unnamed protein product [Urochloa decumbens]|uniref:DUF4220 domain-containing protein n=1 Tax=Urochloa decumbens TaxID=240449 RepID=A0ABC9HA56_9POAL
MSFPEAVQWWQEWQLRILALFSLFLQYFLFMCSLLRKCCIPSWVRFIIWLAYLGSDAIALYALATLFNYPKNTPLGVKVLWAPILLVHLGGQDCMTAYNIEDNELWKRHVLTAISQVTVAVYVFWKSWNSEGKSGEYLAAAILLFIAGILKCILKPWDLKRVSLNSLVESSEPEKNGGINSIENFVQAANTDFSTAESSRDEVEKKEDEQKNPYYLFVDLAPPYSYRLSCLRQFVNNPIKARKWLQSGLSATFDRLYTRESVLYQNFSNTRESQPNINSSRLFINLLFNCIDLLRVIAAVCILAVLVLVPMSQGRPKNTDVIITYILLISTTFLEYLTIVAIIVRMNGVMQQWPDQVSQYNLIWYLARNKECKTKMIRKVATLLVHKDFLDQYWGMPSCKSSSYITYLVHGYLEKGWKERHITNMATYREFNDNRGQWTLNRKNCSTQLNWSLQKPFDECVVLWHLATDICFHNSLTTQSSQRTQEVASRSREISNYMAYLLFVNPEMLMTGARRSLLREAYRQLKKTLKVTPQPVVAGPTRQDTPLLPDDAGLSREGTPPQQDESKFTKKIFQNIQHAVDGQDISIVRDACKLATVLLKLNMENMWEVIRGVWVEMLCFSAGRSRGYLHAKSLGQGGEYLSYIWLLLSYMGMETLAEKMQRANGITDDGSSTTTASPVVATGGTGDGTATPVSATGGSDSCIIEASPAMTTGGGGPNDAVAASLVTPNGDENV